MFSEPFTDPSQTGDFFIAFLGIFLEGAPYIFIGTLISGIIDAYLPPGMLDRLLPKNRAGAIFLSGFLGLIFPVCECAIVPVIRRLVQKGLPVSCAITYMLSAPIINPIVIYSTYSAFNGTGVVGGWYMTFSRLGIAYIVAVLVGFVVQRFSMKSILSDRVLEGIDEKHHDHSENETVETVETVEKVEQSKADEHKAHDHAPKKKGGSKLVHAMRTAQRDLLDTGMYFTIGVLITALYRSQIKRDAIDHLAQNDFVGVPMMMVLAFILSLCSTSDAFIAAQMVFSAAARQAFLVFGPMMDVKLVFMYAVVFRKKFVVLMVIGLFFLIAALCMMWGQTVPMIEPNLNP
ncbi:MAG: uncharacterized membrane protein YraQ (UPF0718 family) [Pseudoalteromonas tetraodonis]|jgi:uncharacterized membrane protein YraQ (UPF0718 family)